ncbi:hypothetical protein BC332_23194 [Capsicum chinense]|nr:hypothetical protein BC332_23194 [Capsicum chinense]
MGETSLLKDTCNITFGEIRIRVGIYRNEMSILNGRDNRYLQFIKDFRQTLPEDRRDLPLSQEQNERIWLDVVGDSSRGIPPCPDDVVCPPRPPQSLSISHGVYDQYKDVTEDPSSDEDDEDYYVDNIPSRC